MRVCISGERQSRGWIIGVARSLINDDEQKRATNVSRGTALLWRGCRSPMSCSAVVLWRRCLLAGAGECQPCVDAYLGGRLSNCTWGKYQSPGAIRVSSALSKTRLLRRLFDVLAG
ncbi:hypothetical protein AVEN_162430-1 [Araneus ventricosus]|uniref:Uncharacterized protein n=1 Tax=Araneus ventricosus TaxID=182803 RepID=A0A4Y2NLK1_ARAVE|nr:hypothetical protein AVEN_162430-1 [Araneus ventricosus]